MNFSKFVLSGALGIALLAATSCGTPKNVAYFQDLNNNPDTVITLQNRVITVKPTDKIYIGVKSKDPQISQLFNLTGGTSGSGAYNMSHNIISLLVAMLICVPMVQTIRKRTLRT